MAKYSIGCVRKVRREANPRRGKKGENNRNKSNNVMELEMQAYISQKGEDLVSPGDKT